MESVHEYFNEIKKDVTKYCNNCDKDVLMFARLKDEQLTFKGDSSCERLYGSLLLHM